MKEEEKPQKEYLSVNEFASLVSVHPNTIRNSIKKGKINAFRIGAGDKSDWRIARSELNRIALFDLERMVDNMVEKKIKERKNIE